MSRYYIECANCGKIVEFGSNWSPCQCKEQEPAKWLKKINRLRAENRHLKAENKRLKESVSGILIFINSDREYIFGEAPGTTLGRVTDELRAAIERQEEGE